jgi:peptide/nickel transport system substrate-binding protein
LLGLAGALAVGASARAQGGTPQRGGIVTVGLAQLPTVWDPLGTRDFNTIWISTIMYDSLFQMGTDGNITAGLALFVSTSVDGETLTIELRPDAYFADGQPVTANDVVASLQRTRATSWRLESVRSISTLADSTVEIVTNSPDAALPVSLASPELPILPMNAPPFAEAVENGHLPVGSGPFRPLPLESD